MCVVQQHQQQYQQSYKLQQRLRQRQRLAVAAAAATSAAAVLVRLGYSRSAQAAEWMVFASGRRRRLPHLLGTVNGTRSSQEVCSHCPLSNSALAHLEPT